MSANSIIVSKISAKREEIGNRYSKKIQEVRRENKKNLSPAVAKYNKLLGKLISDSEKEGVNLVIDVSYNWQASSNKRTAKCCASDSLPAKYAAKVKSLEDEKKKALKSFDKLSDRAQLVALLPAKERRDEILAIISEIEKV